MIENVHCHFIPLSEQYIERYIHALKCIGIIEELLLISIVNIATLAKHDKHSVLIDGRRSVISVQLVYCISVCVCVCVRVCVCVCVWVDFFKASCQESHTPQRK